MKTTATVNVVRMSKGDDFVRFETEKGTSYASMHNSKGEAAFLSIDEARERIAILAAQGWRAA